MVLDLAAKLTAGRPMPDNTVNPRSDVVIASAEDGLADTIVPRLMAAGADLARCHIIRTVPARDVATGERVELPVQLPRDLGRIEATIRQTGAGLLIVDVLMSYLSGVDAHKDQDVRLALSRIGAMAERTGACVVMLRHLNKSGNTQAILRGGGSIGIIGAARVGLFVGYDPDDDDGKPEDERRHVLAVAKINLAKRPDAYGYRLVDSPDHGCSRIEWLGTVTHTADMLASPSDGSRREAEEAATAWLAERLADGPVPTKEVDAERKVHDIQERPYRAAKKALGTVARKQEGAKDSPWWLCLPQQEPPTPGEAPVPFVATPLPIDDEGDEW